MRDGKYTLMLIVIVLMCIAVMKTINYEEKVIRSIPLTKNVVVDMWRFESTPADRREILQGLTAKECIDAGLCKLAINLPVAE